MTEDPNYEMTSTLGSPYNMSDQEAAEYLRTHARRITGVFRLHNMPAAGFPWFPLVRIQHAKFVQYRDSHPLPISQVAVEDYYRKYADMLDPRNT